MNDHLEALRSRLAARESLDVAADLTVTFEGEPLHVESYTDHVVVTLPSLALARSLLGRHGERIGDVAGLLEAADLSAEVRVRSRPVARLGVGVTPGVLGRRLGWGPVRLRPLGIVLLAFD